MKQCRSYGHGTNFDKDCEISLWHQMTSQKLGAIEIMIHEMIDSNWQEQVSAVRKELSRAIYVTAITGAGLSVASGLPVESDVVDGVPVKEFFNKEFWQSTPDLFYKLYRKLSKQWRGAVPNAGHIALAHAGVRVVTQNVDGLHRDAGTEYLLELHGNLRELRCDSCHSIFNSTLAFKNRIPVCNRCGKILRPGIAFEGEQVRHVSFAFDWIGRSDVLLIVGTKLHMSPLNIAHRIASENGASVVWINTAADVILSEIFM
jgi:NAD-dependent deacetylase